MLNRQKLILGISFILLLFLTLILTLTAVGQEGTLTYLPVVIKDWTYGESSGVLDPDFGGDGIVTTDFGGFESGHNALLQPDGKIVAAGVANFGENNALAMSRYNPDGSLDKDFNGSGRVVIYFSSDSFHDSGVSLQSDGKIVVAGYVTSESDSDFALMRFNSDGTLDTSFDEDGRTTVEFDVRNSYATSVMVQPDGNILAAGYVQGDTDIDFALVRLNPDGSLDTTFDDDGKVATDFSGVDDYGMAIVQQADDRIIMVGYAIFNTTSLEFLVARYNIDGSLDTNFDGDGWSTTDFGDFEATSAYANAVALQSDGKIVLVGYFRDGFQNDIALARFNPDGILDTTFDVDGMLTTDFNGQNNQANSVAVQSNGKIIVAGYTTSELTDNNIIVARYLPDGSLDLSFGQDGIVITDINEDSDTAHDIVIQPDGKIVVAGGCRSTDTEDDFAIVRYR